MKKLIFIPLLLLSLNLIAQKKSYHFSYVESSTFKYGKWSDWSSRGDEVIIEKPLYNLNVQINSNHSSFPNASFTCRYKGYYDGWYTYTMENTIIFDGEYRNLRFLTESQKMIKSTIKLESMMEGEEGVINIFLNTYAVAYKCIR
ncbi:hypothetical protein [uncultured Sunxiuqinia sp.]|uniref:hypothetical protein n=1 Tax=uncultured Sunxiuqinia sp. TaxID=1573825 RepID=UPI002AA90D30|nr:hypothetical protein [uncultured Sunxiuqinia sp.]